MQALVCPLFDNRLRICAKVDEQAKLAASQPKVVHQLRPVLLGQRLHRLNLDNDLPEAASKFAVNLVDRAANGVALFWIYHLLVRGRAPALRLCRESRNPLRRGELRM